MLLAAALSASTGVWWYRTSRPGYRLERGREAIRRDDWRAVDAIADRLDAAGETDRALLLRGEALVRQRCFAEALEMLNRIQDRGAIRFEAAVLSGRCLLEMRMLREAHGVYAWVVEQQPEHVDARRGLAAIAYDLGQLPQAVFQLEQVAALDPADGRPHRLVGLIHKDLSRFAEAEAAYREALRRSLPQSFRRAARHELAEVLLRQHRFAETLTVLDEIGEPDAGDVGARAEALVGLNREEEARAILEPALSAYPTDATLLRLLGQLHLKDRQVARAVKRLEQAVALAPRDEVARYHLGLAYSADGQASKAAQQQAQVDSIRVELKQLTDLSNEAMKKPWDAGVRLRLADLCQRMDNPNLAAMWGEAAKACQGAN